MNAINCLVCGGKYFRKVYYEIDVDVDIYPTDYNSVNVKSKDLNDVNVDVDTFVDNKIDANGDISMSLVSEENDSSVDFYKYNCEECGFIMSFTKEKGVESKFEEKKRKEKENAYDWTNFGE